MLVVGLRRPVHEQKRTVGQRGRQARAPLGAEAHGKVALGAEGHRSDGRAGGQIGFVVGVPPEPSVAVGVQVA
jgi:hypothetical protein